MSDCIFCKIVDKLIPADIVYEDNDMLCFRDINPSAPVHLLLVPKKHVDTLAHLTNDDQELIGKIMLKLPQIVHDKGLKNWFKTLINTGKAG